MARIFDLPETKRGVFDLRGIVIGVESNNFYTEKKTKTGKDFRNVNFGVAYDDHKTVYMDLNGMPRDKVYFSKKGDDGKSIIRDVPWAQRNKPIGDGFRMIGTTVGLTKVENEKGQLVNDRKIMPEFDACAYIRDNLSDDSSVFVQGNIEYSSFTDNSGNVRRRVKYIPTQILLCKEDIKFDEYDGETKKPKHAFTQTFIYTGVEKEMENDKPTGRYILNGKVVTYNSIENVEYIVTDSSLANLFRKNLKPYTSIEVSGKIEVVHTVDTTVDEDCWGQPDERARVNSPSKIELVVTGAKPSTRDSETYTEQKIADAIKKINASKNADKNFGEPDSANSDVDDWGDTDNDDEDEPW